ncbi:hypothetical protein BS50DRAFT_623088 [Corynespora cassiicola Philippines]|uniref:Uncharacterized protein n=1 Tax=Corynespora cassiicola Philippines TaxID=1448308 RepID=A0A2T2NGP0_CORCC|nr:hypothetical protein BS50DRAFT_623088 [Corynespora cassiicola Philippines]
MTYNMRPRVHKHETPSPRPAIASRGKGKGKEKTKAATPHKPKRGTRKKKGISAQKAESHPAASWTQPKNPQATFLGLPAELRLQIYSYVFESPLIHVHCHEDEDLRDPEETLPTRFTWTACRAVNPQCSLLCANPKWSGLCKEEERCSYIIKFPPPLLGFAALRWTSKFIQYESQEFILKSSTIAVDPAKIEEFIRFLKKRAPSQLQHIRHINLFGTQERIGLYGFTFQPLQRNFPNLKGIACQLQSSSWDALAYKNTTLDNLGQNWGILQEISRICPSTTVALEAWMYKKPYPSDEDIQTRFRCMREANLNKLESTRGNGFEMEFVQLPLVAWKPRAFWRRWWHHVK